MNFDQIMLRAKQALKVSTDKEVSELLGMSKTAIAERKRRGAFPEDKLRLLAVEQPELNLDVDYILTGQESLTESDRDLIAVQRAFSESAGVGLPEEIESKIGELIYSLRKRNLPAIKLVLKDLAELSNEGFVMVPRYDVCASAGNGAAIHSESIVDHLAFKQDWINQMGLSKKDLALIEVQGDSMEPAIMHNDLILIDLRESKLSANGVYAIQHMGNLFVKRIQIRMDGSVVIKSDNPNYEPEILQPAEAENLTVVGRVAWFGRQL
ncbi:LexA family transcriptional regulator [Cellvibrio mixtus]|nr:S24 family peptidase [Cellvibrio mixtus]